VYPSPQRFVIGSLLNCASTKASSSTVEEKRSEIASNTLALVHVSVVSALDSPANPRG